MTYWQVAAGADGRDYSDYLLKYGIACVNDKKFIRQVEAGDVLILKAGLNKIAAVGVAELRDGRCAGVCDSETGDKAWLQDFDGWDLPAYCNVRWHKPETPKEVKGLTRAQIARVHKDELQKAADEVLRSTPAHPRKPEPDPTHPVSDEELIQELRANGLQPPSAEGLMEAFRRLRQLAIYYRAGRWQDIREHETRTFLVLPLLLALGWTEQQIKIELGTDDRSKRRIDVACFSKPYQRRNEGNRPNHDDCRLIIETKGFNSGLDYAPDQARAYAASFPETQALVVTNGYCYKIFVRDETGDFCRTPHAYLNLLKPQSAYPLQPDTVKGAEEVLIRLLPRTEGVPVRV